MWITFQARGVPLGKYFNKVRWRKWFAKDKNDLMHLNNFKERFAFEYGCPSENQANTAN